MAYQYTYINLLVPSNNGLEKNLKEKGLNNNFLNLIDTEMSDKKEKIHQLGLMRAQSPSSMVTLVIPSKFCI